MRHVPRSIPLILSLALPALGCVQVDFDSDDGGEIVASCFFSETLPLRDAYLAKGARFAGGGGILDTCSSFDIAEGFLSAPNFLAHNPAEQYSDGSSAAPPTRISFATPATTRCVAMNVASGISGTMMLDAYAADDSFLVSASVELARIARRVEVVHSEGGIAYVILDATSGVFVVDDLVFGQVCPE